MPVAVYVAAKKVDMPLDAYLRHERLQSCFASFDASVNADVSTLVFPSEEVYTMFILRWGHDI